MYLNFLVTSSFGTQNTTYLTELMKKLSRNLDGKRMKQAISQKKSLEANLGNIQALTNTVVNTWCYQDASSTALITILKGLFLTDSQWQKDFCVTTALTFSASEWYLQKHSTAQTKMLIRQYSCFIHYGKYITLWQSGN